jgi:hypothetical protein
MGAHPNTDFMDSHKHVIEQPCCPTNGLGYTLHTTGMGAWIGNQMRPSMALLDQHIRYLDQSLDQRYLATTNLLERNKLALAWFSNLLLWLGWLCSSESFGLTWSNLLVIESCNSATIDLPDGCGLVRCHLEVLRPNQHALTAQTSLLGGAVKYE